jgi:hypothetical protein
MTDKFQVPPAESDDSGDKREPLRKKDVGAWADLGKKLAIDSSSLAAIDKIQADWAEIGGKFTPAQLNTMAFSAAPFERLEIPLNPAHETNELLAQMVATSMAVEREAREQRAREHKWRKVNTGIAVAGTLFAGAAAVMAALAL